jgi:dTDP-glucose 4,6-dehydratase
LRTICYIILYIIYIIMNVLITGGCGFIGSNFINFVYEKKIFNKIVNLDILYYCANESNVNEYIRNSQNYIFIKGDINDTKLVSKILSDYKIELVIHFAAQTYVDLSFENSMQFTIDNVFGTHNLLECCRQYSKLKKFIHISTDEVYGESEFDDIIAKNEQSMVSPTNPYAATKVGAEMLALSYFKSYNFPLNIVRCNNAYGKHQYPEKLIPKFIMLLKENKKVTIHGTGINLRTFIHTSDIVSGILTIISNGKNGEIYNIGNDEEYTILEIAKLLIKKIKCNDNYDKYIEFINDRLYNDKRYFIDYTKLKNIGWVPLVKIDDGINELI